MWWLVCSVGTVGQERIKITFPEELELAGEVLVR